MRHAAFGLVAALAATPASALSIGVFGDHVSAEGIAGMYSAHGHVATAHAGAAMGDATLIAPLDVIISLRTNITQDVVDRVAAGALLITEYWAAASAVNTFELLEATDVGIALAGTGTPITLTAAGLDAGLGADLDGGSWDTASGATEVFRLFWDIGPAVEVLATRPGDFPVLLGGTFGSGRVLIAGWNWADQAYDADIDTGNERFLINAVGYGLESAVVPLPAAAPLLAVGLAALAGLARRRRRA